ncbi:MAG: electron transfer flavoprotein subunit beta/FixA family protein [Peptococcaceae bacterium]
MKIAVCIKQTFDTEAVICLNSEGAIDKTGVKLILNPYDEFAVEEALRIKEKNGGEVIVFSVGGEEPVEAIRQALAMGADRAVLIQDSALAGYDHYGVALALSKAIEQEQCDIILSGWVSIDDGSVQVAGRIAQILDLPQITVVTKVMVEGGKVICQREGDGIAHVVESTLPVLITAQKGLNEPRYPNLKSILQAKKKPIKTVALMDLGLPAEQVEAKIENIGYSIPVPRKAGKILDGEAQDTVGQLVNLLRNEAKVI